MAFHLFILDPWGEGTACVRHGEGAGRMPASDAVVAVAGDRLPPVVTARDGCERPLIWLLGRQRSWFCGWAMRVHVATALPFYASRGAWRDGTVGRVQGVNSGKSEVGCCMSVQPAVQCAWQTLWPPFDLSAWQDAESQRVLTVTLTA